MMRRTAVAWLAAILACKGSAPPPNPPAAKVENPVTEAELTRIHLTPEAEQRLGLATSPVEQRAVPETRTVGGVVVTPPGRSFSLVAPVAGTVLAPPGGIPAAGTSVHRGQALVRLVPLPPETELVRADEAVAVAEVRARQAEQDAARIEELARDSLVSRRELERALADRDAARAALAAARARLNRQRSGMPPSGDEPGLTALTIASPDAGVVLDLFTSPGQIVAAHAPLLTVARLDPLWVKAAVFAGDLARIDPRGAASVDVLSETGRLRRARRVTAPTTADPLSASADVFYQLESSAGLRPGQRVDITIQLKVTGPLQRVVPLGAILYDASGGAWVYVAEGNHTYVRKRVILGGFVGEWAVLASGPPPGTPVVTTGAAELFGVEFGPGK
ncbi:MAG: efflux RND transporter periplasmic adaptor subunit [Gemmatimonadales bacterium]